MEADCVPQPNEKTKEEVKVAKSKSFINKLFGCFSPSEDASESELDAESEYLVMNHSVYKIPKPNQNADKNSLPNSDSESNHEDQQVVYQYDSKTKGRKKGIKNEPTISRSPLRQRLSEAREDVEYQRRLYDYVRMKTYEKMNPYHMSPNEFLNNLSSVFVDNLKDPIPKDPLNLPKIYNRYIPRQRFFQRSKGPKIRKGSLPSNSKKIRAQKKFGMVSRHVETDQEDGPFSYKEAIEDDQPYSDVEEKVLIWKIVVVNEKNENKV